LESKNKSIEELLSDVADKIYADNKKLLRETKNFFELSLAKLSASIKKNAETANYVHGTVLKHEKYLKALKASNENVEETLGNVLLAIKQNEFLQAWYPAQHGYPDLKVTGKHPAKVKAMA
jgi:hypothetical protein